MIKKTFTYKDFDGNEQSETFYFHISKAELVEYEVREKHGMSTALQKMVNERDPRELLKTMKEFVMMALGEKSEDGRRFIKNDDIRRDFESSPAWDQMFEWLMTEPGAASEFFGGIVPEGIDEFASKMAGPKKPADRKQKQTKTAAS